MPGLKNYGGKPCRHSAADPATTDGGTGSTIKLQIEYFIAAGGGSIVTALGEVRAIHTVLRKTTATAGGGCKG